MQTRHAEVTKKRDQSKGGRVETGGGEGGVEICLALQLVRALGAERRLLIQQTRPLWIIKLYMPLKHSHLWTQNPRVPAGPMASISCSSVRQG